jgi:hypothetical protein
MPADRFFVCWTSEFTDIAPSSRHHLHGKPRHVPEIYVKMSPAMGIRSSIEFATAK